MSSPDIKYHLKLQRFKSIFYPAIVFLDKTRLLPLCIPIINTSLKTFGIKKQYQKDLNYRLIGKASKNYFKRDDFKSEKIMLVPFFKSADNMFLLWSFAIAKKLESYGYTSRFIICDKSLPICSNQRVLKTTQDDKFLCYNCYNGYRYIESVSGVNFIRLSDFVETREINLKNEEIDRMSSIEECRKSTYNGYQIGELNYSSVLRFFQTGEMKAEKKYLDIYKKYLKAAVFFIDGWTNYLAENNIKPDLLLILNGVLSSDSLVVEYSKRNSIKYVTHENFYGSNSWMYKVNGDIMTLFWEKEWSSFSKKKFTEEEKERATEFMTGFKNGEKHYIKFNYDHPMDSRLEKNKFVVLFTNLNFDTAVIGRNPVFDSMYAWIEKVIDFWIQNNIKTKLVIRVHPAEAKTMSVADDRANKRILPLIKGQDNIIFFDAEDKVDSYKLIQSMKFSLIYASTIGLEVAILKKICLVAGNAHYRNQNFALFYENENDYFVGLSNLLKEEKVDNLFYNDALKYAYFLFNIRIKKINGLHTDHLNKVNNFDFKDLDDLISKNETVLNDFIDELNTYD